MVGRLITIEGLDGSGKSTLVAGLVAELERRELPVTALREPGGVELAERLRDLVKDPSLEVSARAEALIYAAARAQLVGELVLPLLEAGRFVVLDRYIDSSLSYQGAGRELGVEAVAQINQFATGGLAADRTLYLRVDAATRAERIGERGEAADRLELAGDEFFKLAGDAYDELAAAEPERICVLDGAAAPEVVLAAAIDAISELLP
ncbi:MAG: dTMP kinase [Actinomycetes bacterium]|jgi:dTMP kinase